VWSGSILNLKWAANRFRWMVRSDGCFRKDYGNWNRKQLVPTVVSFAKQETEIGNTYGSVRPARPPEANILRRQLQKKNLGCCSASESVFAGILDQIFRGFHRLKKRLFRRRSLENVTNLRSWSQMYWKMYVSWMSWCMWCVREGPTGGSLWR